MYRRFENLSEEKKQTILEAAVREFAESGFENASTNNIIKEAGISKGILFHYFGNKKKLFLYVFDHCLKLFVDRYFANLPKFSHDLFQRLAENTALKLRLYYELPSESKLITKTVIEIPPDLKEDIASRLDKIQEISYGKFFEGIDTSKFREGVEPQKGIEMLILSLEGVQQKYLRTYKHDPEAGLANVPAMAQELEQYLDILKYGLYDRNTE